MQSLRLVILQIISIFLGIASTFWVAASLPPEIFAITAIHLVISSVVVVFSNTGLETHAIRNVLLWEQINEKEKIREILTQAIFCRFILALVVTLPLIFYCLYISENKFGGDYLMVLIISNFFSVISAVNDSLALLLKSFNRFFEAALIFFVIQILGKIFALISFFNFGFLGYMYTLILIPLVTVLPSFLSLKKWIQPGLFLDRKRLFQNLKLSKSFTFSAYFSYLFNYLDQFLVTLFLTPELIASFSIAKRISVIAKQFFENIFDPQIQKLVMLKSNLEKLQSELAKIIRLKNALLFFAIVICPVAFLAINPLIRFIGLTQYPELYYLFVTVIIAQILGIAIQAKYNFITLFYPQNYYFRLTAIKAMLSIGLLTLIINIFHFRYIFSFAVITNFILLTYVSYIFATKIELTGIRRRNDFQIY